MILRSVAPSSPAAAAGAAGRRAASMGGIAALAREGTVPESLLPDERSG